MSYPKNQTLIKISTNKPDKEIIYKLYRILEPTLRTHGYYTSNSWVKENREGTGYHLYINLIEKEAN